VVRLATVTSGSSFLIMAVFGAEREKGKKFNRKGKGVDSLLRKIAGAAVRLRFETGLPKETLQGRGVRRALEKGKFQSPSLFNLLSRAGGDLKT